MVQLATERNASAVREGRVALHHGSALALPYQSEPFDKVLAVNSLHHWSEPLAGLREVRRVLMPGGCVVIIEQPRSETTDDGLQTLTQELAGQLAQAGFRDIRTEFKAMRPAASVAVIGVK